MRANTFQEFVESFVNLKEMLFYSEWEVVVDNHFPRLQLS